MANRSNYFSAFLYSNLALKVFFSTYSTIHTYTIQRSTRHTVTADVSAAHPGPGLPHPKGALLD